MQNQSSYQATQAYQNASTAVSPLRAVIMMIDGAISFLQKSIRAAEARQFEESHICMMRTTAILRGLSHNLNFKKGGAMADRLYKTYHALIMACLRTYGRPDMPVQYRRVIASLTELREAWVSVALQTAVKPAA